MERSLFIQPEALEELHKARRWYENKVVGLGDEFVEEIEKEFQEILKNLTTGEPFTVNLKGGLFIDFHFLYCI